MRQPNIEMQQQIEALYAENEHLTREIAILRDTIKVGCEVCRARHRVFVMPFRSAHVFVCAYMQYIIHSAGDDEPGNAS